MTTPQNTYTHGHHESVLRSHRWRTAENSAAYLLPRLSPGLSLLDVGCGPATITADLAALVAPGAVTAIEISAEALATGEREIADRGLDNVRLAVADVHALDFPDDTFDVVHAHQVLQHVADPVLALREMRRVCKPGGVVAVRDSDYSSFAWFPYLPELDEWLDLFQKLARANGGAPDAARHLLSWAHQAGFTEVTPTASAWCFGTPADRAWWGGLWADRTVGSATAKQAVDNGFATAEDLRRIADAWRRWIDEPDGWISVPSGELVCVA